MKIGSRDGGHRDKNYWGMSEKATLVREKLPVTVMWADLLHQHSRQLLPSHACKLSLLRSRSVAKH